MSQQDDSARDPVRLHAERWAAESPFIDEAAEEQAPIHPWYQGYTPFVEGQEPEEMHGPEAEWEARLTALEAESPFRHTFEQQEHDVALETGEPVDDTDSERAWEQETEPRLRTKLKFLSFLPHSAVVFGKDRPLRPDLMNPGIYDGPKKYKLAPKLQKCLDNDTRKREFRDLKVALVDLTKGFSQPEFAGFHHTDQVFVGNIPKMAAMLAAFQLRRDLRVAVKDKGAKTLGELFDKIRDDWAATQSEVRANVQTFTDRVTRRRDLVLVDGAPVKLSDPKSPQLERIFAAVPPGDPVTIDFSTTGQDRTELENLADAFRDLKPDSQKNLDGLGFSERLRVMMMDRTRASNYIASTIIGDVGYLYIASTLLQSGLFDPSRGGGLWLASNYAGGKWAGGAAVGGAESATAGSLAAFLTLLVKDELVDQEASADMRALLTEEPTVVGLKSRSKAGLEKLPDEGSLVTVLSKGGITPGKGMDDCAFIERQVDTASGKDVIRYVAVGLRSRKSAEWQSLILEFDKCILANNGLTPAQGGQPEHELAFPSDEESPFGETAESAESPFAHPFDEQSYPEPEFPDGAASIREEELGIIGRTDDRLPVRDTLAVPFRWICSIAVQRRIQTASHERMTGLAPAGTGLLISPRHVLTAAHLLRSVEKDDRGGITERHEAQLVAVKPGRAGDASPFGAIEAGSWSIHPKWNPERNSSEFDYAVITLKEAVGDQTFKNLKGERLCFWGSPKCGANTSLDNLPAALAGRLVGARVVTAGYPSVAKGQMWCTAGELSAGSPEVDSVLMRHRQVENWARTARTIYVTADASESQSGSPVWVVDNGKRYLVGILVSIGEKYNRAVAVNTEVVRQIQRWIGKVGAGAQTQKLLDEPEMREEVFESPSTFDTMGESLAEPEEYVRLTARRSPLRIPEGAEWFGEAEEPETFGEAEDGFAEAFEDEAFDHEDEATEERDLDPEMEQDDVRREDLLPAEAAALRDNIARVAREQLARWHNGRLEETEPDGLNILKEYYLNSNITITGRHRLGDSDWHAKNPWSAVFVSWVMKQAGAGDKFEFAETHQKYIIAAKKNRTRKDASKPFWAFSVTEKAPEVGDLICMDRRCKDCGKCSGATFENIDQPEKKPQPRCVHCDVVIAVDPVKKKVFAVGGDVGDSVRRRAFKIGADGKLLRRWLGCPLFAVIKIVDDTAVAKEISEQETEEGGRWDSPYATAEEAEYDTGRRPVKQEAAEDEFDTGLGGMVLEERQLPAPKDTELRHFHMKKTLNVAGSLDTAAKASLMKPLEMRPAYIDSWLDTLETDTSATGLQGLLSELMLGRWSNFLSPESVREKKARATDKLYVALVDLTGAKLSKPEFAGWAPTEAVDGASVPKILALYALFQLRFDLNHLASANSITKKADLLKRAENHWKNTGLVGWPSLGQLFDFVEESGKPVQARFQGWLDATRFDINGNCSVTRLMNGLGFDYIGSVALQSGLRHPARGGMWLGTTYMCGKQYTRWNRDPVPLIAGCVAGDRSGHHITALSVATYYTLLAQGRLVDEPSSKELMTRLERGCSLCPKGFHEGLEVLGDVTRTAQKCGLLGKCTHESILVERDRFRYVAVALAKGVGVPFNLLIQDLDEIIQKRNP